MEEGCYKRQPLGLEAKSHNRDTHYRNLRSPIKQKQKQKQRNLISEADKVTMQPSGKPNRLYGLPKVHKGIAEGKNIPPCRPIVSNSGSNTEMISALVDHYSKHLVKDLQ